ncbi:hypothetical protein AALC25_20340, partial [Lachnospiraceae bacterium 29-84]
CQPLAGLPAFLQVLLESFKVIPLFSCQGHVLSFPATAFVLYHLCLHLSTTFFIFLPLSKTLLNRCFLSAVSLDILSYFPEIVNTFFDIFSCLDKLSRTEKEGFEPSRRY